MVALAGDRDLNPETVCVADPSSSTGYIGSRGTSLSAPIVSSLIALHREKCEPGARKRFGTEFMRALVRNAAWGGNAIAQPWPGTSAYSTPRLRSPQWDFADGAGVLFAEGMASCPDDPGSGGVVINLGGGEGLPPGETLYIEDGIYQSPNETLDRSVNFQPAGYGDPTTQNIVGEKLAELSVAAGQRIRASFSWSACAAEPSAGAPGDIAVDFDLLLRRVLADGSGAQYVWASQSIFDNNEGFDYTVAADEDGIYEVWVVWPEGSISCEGTLDEPGGFALALL